MAEPDRLVSQARRHVRVRRLRDAWQKVVSRAGRQVVLVQRVVLAALLASPRARRDEWDWPQARSSWPAQLAWQAAEPRRAQEPWRPLVQPPRVCPLRWVSPLAQQERPARSVSPRLALRSLAELPQELPASCARLSPPRPWLLFPLWQPLPLVLRLRRLPESFFVPSRRRLRGSSWNASSFL